MEIASGPLKGHVFFLLKKDLAFCRLSVVSFSFFVENIKSGDFLDCPREFRTTFRGTTTSSWVKGPRSNAFSKGVFVLVFFNELLEMIGDACSFLGSFGISWGLQLVCI